MLPTLSVENRIAQIMAAHDITAEFLGQLTSLLKFRGLPQPRISQALRGTKPFSNEQGEFLLALVQELVKICEDLAPVEVSFKNPTVIKDILDARRKGSTRIMFFNDVTND